MAHDAVAGGSAELATLRWQYGLAWRLAEVHLPTLTDAMCTWEPARDAWTVRPVSWPWPEPRPLRILLAWVNTELTKNVAEIGTVRHLYLAAQ